MPTLVKDIIEAWMRYEQQLCVQLLSDCCRSWLDVLVGSFWLFFAPVRRWRGRDGVVVTGGSGGRRPPTPSFLLQTREARDNFDTIGQLLPFLACEFGSIISRKRSFSANNFQKIVSLACRVTSEYIRIFSFGVGVKCIFSKVDILYYPSKFEREF